MSKVQLFRDFINERLALAADEIFGQYEKTLALCQEEFYQSRETHLRRTPQSTESGIKLHRIQIDVPQQLCLPEARQIKEEQDLWTTEEEKILQDQINAESDEFDYGAPESETVADVQELPLPETPQIKEEQELWISDEGEQIQRVLLQSDITDNIINFKVKTHNKPQDSVLPTLYQSPTTNSLASRRTEDYQSEPSSQSHSSSLPSHIPTIAQSVEEERGLPVLPELNYGYHRLPPPSGLKSPAKSRTPQARFSRPSGSRWPLPSPSFRIKTRPILPSSHRPDRERGSFSGETERHTVQNQNTLLEIRRSGTAVKRARNPNLAAAVRRLHNSTGHQFNPEESVSSPHNLAILTYLLREVSVVFPALDQGVLQASCKTFFESLRRKHRLAQPENAEQKAIIQANMRKRQRRARLFQTRASLLATEEEHQLWSTASIDLMSDEEDSVVNGEHVWIVKPPEGRSPELSALCTTLEKRRGPRTTKRIHPQDILNDSHESSSLIPWPVYSLNEELGGD